MIFIKIELGETFKKSESIFKKIVRFCLELLIPKANPDFEKHINDIKYWLLEFENVNSIPSREIGLGINDNIIVKMPYKNNYGYWTDNVLTLCDFKKNFDFEEITKEYFEVKWKSL